MKSSKLFRRVVITVVMLPIAFLLIAWLVNLSFFDEDLNPDIASILQPVQRPPHEGNAYFAMWGISTTADKDMIESGVRLVERYRDKRAKSGLDTLTADDFVEILGAADLDEAWLSDYSCKARTNYGCLANAHRSLQKGSIASSRSQLMLARHQQILQMQLFKNWGGQQFYLTDSTILDRPETESAEACQPLRFRSGFRLSATTATRYTILENDADAGFRAD